MDFFRKRNLQPTPSQLPDSVERSNTIQNSGHCVLDALLVPSSLPLSLLPKPEVEKISPKKQIEAHATDLNNPICCSPIVTNDVEMRESGEVTLTSESECMPTCTDAEDVLEACAVHVEENMKAKVPTDSDSDPMAIDTESNMVETVSTQSPHSVKRKACDYNRLVENLDGPFWSTPSKRRRISVGLRT